MAVEQPPVEPITQRSDVMNHEWSILARVRISRTVRVAIQVVKPADNHETAPEEVESIGHALIWASRFIQKYQVAARRKRGTTQ